MGNNPFHCEHCDYIMYDLKQMDDEKHKAGTKVSQCQNFEQRETLVEMGKKMKFRTPLIPNYNDSKESIRAIASFIRNELGLILQFVMNFWPIIT